MTASGNVHTLGISLSGTPNGSETFAVVPASTTAIYACGWYTLRLQRKVTIRPHYYKFHWSQTYLSEMGAYLAITAVLLPVILAVVLMAD